MQWRFLGSGDAFGSGGRLHACSLLTHAGGRALVDCGASALIAMRRFAVAPNAVDTVLISHLHGDHFGGLPFLLLDAQLVSRREAPLTVAGPEGLSARLTAAQEALYPGSSAISWRFALRIVELTPGRTAPVGGLAVTPFAVRHPSGAPSLALRIEADGRTVAYSGDTEWVDELRDLARDADLLVIEAYAWDQPVPYHLDVASLRARRGELAAKRTVLTHMGAEVLAHAGELTDFELAEDGLTLEV